MKLFRLIVPIHIGLQQIGAGLSADDLSDANHSSHPSVIALYLHDDLKRRYDQFFDGS